MQNELVCYRRLPEWGSETLPDGFRRQHNTREGTWAKLTVLQGALYFYELDAAGDVLARHRFSPERAAPFVEPGAWHRVAPASDDLRCYLEFWCEKERYYEKKYKLSPPHSEVVDAARAITPGAALDLGSGRGRNSVFLQSKGFQVTAVDRSEAAIQKLRDIIASEPACRGIQTDLYDINEARIDRDFDLIVSTVVFSIPSRRARRRRDREPATAHAGGGAEPDRRAGVFPRLSLPAGFPLHLWRGRVERVLRRLDDLQIQ